MNKDDMQQYQYDRGLLLMWSQTVIDWREEYQGVYPWPNTKDSIAFALCETAEAVDAILRNNPDYKRNNDKDHDVLNELGDAMFMIMSVMDYIPGEIYKTALTEHSNDIEQLTLTTSTLSMAILAESDDINLDCLTLLLELFLVSMVGTGNT